MLDAFQRRKLEDLPQDADYDLAAVFTMEGIAESLAQARAFVDEATALLERR